MKVAKNINDSAYMRVGDYIISSHIKVPSVDSNVPFSNMAGNIDNLSNLKRFPKWHQQFFMLW